MSSDISLSQSLGGLRIANPDHDGNAMTSSSSVQSPSAQTSQPPKQSANTGRALRPDGNSNGIFAQFQSSTYPLPMRSPPIGKYSQTGPSLDGDTSQYTESGAGYRQDYTQDASRLTRPSGANRPTSGFYTLPNVSSGSTSLPESAYQRLRAESTQSNNPPQSGTVRRSNSKAAAAAAMKGVGHLRQPIAGIFRHSSQSRHNASAQPARYAGDQYGNSPPVPNDVRNGSYSTSPPLRSTEEFQENGAAVSGSEMIDQGGKPASKVVKKGVKDFSFGRTLGEGSYSTVLAAKDRQSGREYAIKVLDKRHIIKEKKVKYVNIEKDTLNRLTDHPGVVRLYYTFQDERSLYFVLDLAAGGELLSHLKKTGSFDEECTRFYGAQMLDSVEYMHERGIIHRDLKPENILLDDQMHVKITDFGTAKILDLNAKPQFGTISVNNDPLDGANTTDRAMSFVGTAEYVSPELLTDKNACKASDLWAFGCILFQLLAGRPPFKANNEYLTFQKIVRLEYSFPEGFPHLAKDLISKLLVLDPMKRPSISSIKMHPFFQGIQWGRGLWKQKAPRLKAYSSLGNALAFDASAAAGAALRNKRELPVLQRQSSYTKIRPSSGVPAPSQPRPQQAIITELAPPTQLDIDWSPVLTKANERILKLGQFAISASPAPHSPSSKNGSSPPAESQSKLSRLFGASGPKKRQRLVLITSGGRLILAAAGGEKKEAKQSIDLTDPEVSWKSQQDSKGYTVWSIYTRKENLTFEDPKANTGDSGSSVRSTQEWISCLEDVRNYAEAQQQRDIYVASPTGYSAHDPLFNNLSPTASTQSTVMDDQSSSMSRPDSYRHGSSNPPMLRKTLRKEPSNASGSSGGATGGNDDAASVQQARSRGRGMWGNKRHSKNGLAAVF